MRKSLAKWIDEALVDKEKDAPCSALSLVHMVGQTRQEIHSIKIAPTGSYDGKTLEGVFRGKAEAYSQDLQTVQMFALLAFYGKNTEESVQPFSCMPAHNPETMGLSTEAPTVEGRTQQAMRWADAQQTQVYRRQQTMDDFSIRMLEQQGRMVDRQGQMLERVMHDNMEAFTIVKDLLMQLSDKREGAAMARAEYERSTQERQKLMDVAPLLINQITGREVFPQSKEDTILVETLAQHVTPEHVEMLAALGLPPELLGPLASRFKRAIEEREAKAAAANKVLPAYRGPIDEDVTGGMLPAKKSDEAAQ